jgi:mRNA degradation ribonuclease J1/J2
MTGPLVEFVVVESIRKWGDEDGVDPNLKEYYKEHQADLQRINARANACVEGIRRIIEEILPEYSLPSSGETPKMIRTLQTKVRPDKVNEYLALWKS